MSSLVFLHLSDIHFQRNAGNTYDPYAGLRNELELDVQSFSAATFKSVNAILITGDVAYSGDPEEYAYAQAWIEKIAGILKLIPGEDVFVIPGNHDIQRDVVRKSATIQGYHAALREPNRDPNVALVDYLQKDDEAKRIIFKPLQNYNDFAARYQCNISAEEPYWEHPFALSDGSTLNLRGMNSTLISDEHDSDTAHKLVVGDYQLELLRQDGVEHMILCHHPPQWMVDQDQAETLLTSRARIQLFGHKHMQRVTRIEDSVRVVAGAMHPEKREPNWKPKYNFIEVDVEVRGADTRILVVRGYPRVYEDTKFVSGNEGASTFRQDELPLPLWTTPTVATPSAPKEITDAAVKSKGGLRMRPGRRLTYRFLNLPHHSRVKIVQELGLVREDDEGLRDAELYSRYFSRAAEAGSLPKLWDLVNDASSTREENPFSKMRGAA